VDIAYTLEVDGAPADGALLAAVRRIEVEDHADMADMLRLTLAMAVKTDGSGWSMLDDDVFPRLCPIRLALTVGRGASIPLIAAHVMESRAVFGNDPGGSTLTVVAMDPTVLMHLEEKVKAWPNMADSDVASAIFSDAAYGFTPVVEATGFVRDDNEHTLLQRGTDIQFLRQLAERNGYECYVELNAASGEIEGHFHPPRHDEDPQGVLSVNLGQATNVNAFRARHEQIGPATASVTGLDAASGEDQPATVDATVLAPLGSSEPVSGDRPRHLLLSGTGMALGGELQAYAQAVVDRSAWAITAEGELNTVAYGGVMRAKRPVTVRGAGRAFSGTYYVERVLHAFTGDGYVQRFTLRRNAVGLTGRERFTDDGGLG
jgi:phage protein D